MEELLKKKGGLKGFQKGATLTGVGGVGYKEEAVERDPEAEAAAAAAAPEKKAERKPLWEILQEAKERTDEDQEAAAAPAKNEDGEVDFHRQLDAKEKAVKLEQERYVKKQVKDFEASVAKRQEQEKEESKKRARETSLFNIPEQEEPEDLAISQPKKKKRKSTKQKGSLVDY